MSQNVIDMINALQQDKMSDAQDAFKAEIGDRIQSALDTKKIEVAADIYGGAEEVTTDVDLDDMEIDAEDNYEGEEAEVESEVEEEEV